MNIWQNYITLYLQLTEIGVWEVPILFMIYSIGYVFQIKHKITATINDSKILTNHISCDCNCKLTVANLTQTKSGEMINVGVSAKS